MNDDFEQTIAAHSVERGKHYEAVGYFVMTYAEVESVLYRTLLHYAKMSEEIGRSVFAGQRVKAITQSIEKIAINTNVPALKLFDLKFLFSQMAAINTMRDYVIHNGHTSVVVFDSGEKKTGYQYIHNEKRSPIESKSWMYRIDIELLSSMQRDLLRITLALGRHLEIDAHDSAFKPTESGDPSTWFYKPAPPIRTRRQSLATPPAPHEPPIAPAKKQPKSAV